MDDLKLDGCATEAFGKALDRTRHDVMSGRDVIISGESGTGKSSVLADVIRTMPGKRFVVFEPSIALAVSDGLSGMCRDDDGMDAPNALFLVCPLSGDDVDTLRVYARNGEPVSCVMFDELAGIDLSDGWAHEVEDELWRDGNAPVMVGTTQMKALAVPRDKFSTFSEPDIIRM